MDQSALELGRARYQERAWADAYRLLTQADESSPLGPDDLALRAWSAALTGQDVRMNLQERVYQAYLDAGRGLAAARAAFWVGFRLMSLGEVGRAGGWLGRAQRLVERGGQPCVEQGYLLLPTAMRQLQTGELEAASATAAQAATLGDQFDNPDLAALARNIQGRALVRQGRVEQGLRLLDEVMVSATTGDLSPLITGLIYCAVIASCQQVYALDRAREWTSVLAGWVEGQPQLVLFTGSCLVHRAEILELSGSWGEAVAEARLACERCPPGIDPQSAGKAHYQEAEILRLKGEQTAAEEAYRAASQFGMEPQPGLALLRLAAGDHEAAASAIRRVLGATTDPFQRVRLLPACVEILLASEALDEARAACQELEQFAAGLATEVPQALAGHARGALLLAEGDAQAALPPLRLAFEVWQKLGAPYLAARLRVMLGRACLALHDADGARLELATAREAFTQLGAAPDLATLDALAAELAGSGKTGKPPAHARGLTARELQVLRLIASGKTNKAIAAELSLSEKTVDRHVSNIFNKVDVTSRAGATAFAYEHKLV